MATVSPILEIFMLTKPGDRFESRKRLLEMSDSEGFEVRSVIMVWCGESEEDRIRHLLYLREIRYSAWGRCLVDRP